jgi:WD40 repeat protein
LIAWTPANFGFALDAHSHQRLQELQGNFEIDPETRHSVSRGNLLLTWGIDVSATNPDPTALAWRVWDERSGAIVATRPGYIDTWTAVSLSADGRSVVGVVGGQLTTYDIAGNDLLAPLTGAQVSGYRNAAVSPTGAVAASTVRGDITFYASPALRRAGQRIAGTGDINQFAFSQDGGLLAARGADNRVHVIDMSRETPLGDPISIAGSTGADVALSPDGSELVVPDPRGLVVWQLRPASWVVAACQVVDRDLTPQEWSAYFKGLGGYHPSCPKRAA